MRWYSPFDWIPGPETEEEMEELKRLRKEREKPNEESSTTSITGMKIAEDHLCNLLNERVFLVNQVRNQKANASWFKQPSRADDDDDDDDDDADDDNDDHDDDDDDEDDTLFGLVPITRLPALDTHYM